MARKTREIRITSGTPETNRDYGKVYIVGEMSATDAELWAADALQGLLASGIELPDGIEHEGMATIASLGFQALSRIRNDLLRSLMERMMDCVGFIPDPKRPEMYRASRTLGGQLAPMGGMIEDDIEEVKTRLELRMAVWEIHTNFSFAAVRSRLAEAATLQNQTK